MALKVKNWWKISFWDTMEKICFERKIEFSIKCCNSCCPSKYTCIFYVLSLKYPIGRWMTFDCCKENIIETVWDQKVCEVTVSIFSVSVLLENLLLTHRKDSNQCKWIFNTKKWWLNSNGGNICYVNKAKLFYTIIFHANKTHYITEIYL